MAACHPLLRSPAAAWLVRRPGWMRTQTTIELWRVTNGYCRPLAVDDGIGAAAFTCDRERTAQASGEGGCPSLLCHLRWTLPHWWQGVSVALGAGPCGQAPRRPAGWQGILQSAAYAR